MNGFTAALAISLLFPSQVCDCSTIPSHSQDWEKKKCAQRETIFQEEKISLKRLKEEVSNHGLEQVIDLLEKDSFVVAPGKSDGKSGSFGTNDFPDSIGILPLLEEDATINEKWKERWRIVEGAKTVYGTKGAPIITLKRETPMSQLWRNVNFFHELMIAANALQNEPRADIRNSEAWLQEKARFEDSAWNCVTELLLSLKEKGRDYQVLVNMEMKRLHTQGMMRPPPMLYSQALNSLFEIPLSPFENNLRETTLWIGAAIRVIDERNPDPQKAKEERERFFIEALRNNHL